MYADDIAAVTPNKEVAQMVIDVMTEYAQDHGITWAPEKCYILAKDRVILKINEEVFPQMDRFKYLGMDITYKGVNANTHVARLITNAKNKVKVMRSCGMTSYGGPPYKAIKLYKSFIRPNHEYGLATIKPTKTLINKLNQAQGAIIKSILGVPRNASTAAACIIVNIPQMDVRWRALITKYIERWRKLPEEAMLYSAIQRSDPSNSENDTLASKWVTRISKESIPHVPGRSINRTIKQFANTQRL